MYHGGCIGSKKGRIYMSINITAKTDYSTLLSSLGSSSSSSNSIYSLNLSDYASIRNGSYSKLLKAYYKKQDSDSTTSSTSTKKDTTTTSASSAATTVKKEMSNIQSEATALQESASTLIQKGTKSVFKDEDMDTIYNAVSTFVDDYNALMDSSQDSSSSTIVSSAKNMANSVSSYKDSLKNVGITIDDDNKLSIDKDTFQSADIDDIKSLFNGKSSLAYVVSMRAVSMGNTAYSESNSSSLYTSSGTYSSVSTSDLYSSLV
jgi:hypothetical protein